jgi:lycopene beta-cyclase
VTLTIGIRGGGLAGIAVAEAITNKVSNCSVHIFDKRDRTPHPERTFCFFGGLATEQFNLPIAQRWPKVLFSGNKSGSNAGAPFKRICDCSQTPYSIVHGEDFFSQTLSKLEARGVNFSWGASRVEVCSDAIIADSSNFKFDLVIDTAFEVSQVHPLMWQSFAGHWVTTTSDRFDPGVATLMEIQESSAAQAVNFMYVLPMSRRAALVEHTSFCASAMDPQSHLQQCDEWFKKNGITDWQISRAERGLIPMGLPLRPRAPGVVALGSAAGSIRASTGYGFIHILKQAQEVALYVSNLEARAKAGLIQEKILNDFSPSQYPAWMSLSDKIFLCALQKMPQHGANLMSRLLERAPEGALLKFLAGDADLLSAFRVMLSAPKTVMLRALPYAL